MWAQLGVPDAEEEGEGMRKRGLCQHRARGLGGEGEDKAGMSHVKIVEGG